MEQKNHNSFGSSHANDLIQFRLLILAALFLFFFSTSLSISGAVRSRNWAADYLVDHWIGFLIWLATFLVLHFWTKRKLPGRDPFLLPVTGLLCGWGMLTIWRVYPEFGLRQSLWLIVCAAILLMGMHVKTGLRILRRYKYVWLTASILLTAATLFLGVNPLGFGSKMWLGCCGIYLQPSEPLKLMLIIFLAAYLADQKILLDIGIQDFEKSGSKKLYISSFRQSFKNSLLILSPTLVMTGLAIVVLLIQRDLGMATVILFLYTVIVYTATSRRSILILGGALVLTVGLWGYIYMDTLRTRIEAWVNPWIDPSGNSFQIVQSLIASANGGTIGRGPGLGSPGLVPVVHSDLVYTAIVEEGGLFGAIGLLVLFGIISNRGIKVALFATDNFRRFLAVGLTAYLVGQGLLIIGGNLRLLPLAGITLPFVAYGGSSLLTSFVALLLLLRISDTGELEPLQLIDSKPYLHLEIFLLGCIAFAGLATGWWSIIHRTELLSRTDNARRAISDRWVRRGSLLDRNGISINTTTGEPGNLDRSYLYPELSNIAGYINPIYGQSGYEANLDDYLRGVKGNEPLDIWSNEILYGQPPPGLDIRLSLDLDIQSQADQLLGNRRGALIVLDSQTGEILAMASHPTFDANQLENEWEDLIANEESPLLNRATLGMYPVGELEDILQFDLFEPVIPVLGIPAQKLAEARDPGSNLVSPMQIALAAATISSGGIRPTPRLVLAVLEPDGHWETLVSFVTDGRILSEQITTQIAESLVVPEKGIWQKTSVVPLRNDQKVTWSLGGKFPISANSSYAVVVLLEEENFNEAERIVQSLFRYLQTHK